MQRDITRDRQDDMRNLPHGARVTIPGSPDVLTMNREELPEPFFDCVDGAGKDTGWLRWHNVFALYGVESVTVRV